MPAVSQAQFRWLHTPAAKKALGSSGVNEWIGATGSPSGLPERSNMAKDKWMGGAIRRPGKLTQEASENGRGKLAQAEVDSHSKDPSKRGRGVLGVRLIKGHGKP